MLAMSGVVSNKKQFYKQQRSGYRSLDSFKLLHLLRVVENETSEILPNSQS